MVTAMTIVGYALASMVIVVNVLFIILFNGYVFLDNETNHTSAPLEAGTIIFVLIAVAAGIAVLNTRGVPRRLWLAALALAVLAAANIAVFGALHVMIPYETWVHGQPDRPEWSIMRR